MVVKTGGTIKEISGDVRAHNGWCQTIGLPTVMDSANQIVWHMSKGHTKAAGNFVVVAVNFDQNNLLSHMATKKINCFQRGYTMQMLQVLQGHSYKFIESELQQVVALYYQGYNVLQLVERFTWNNGYVWAFSLPISVNNAMDAKDDNPENPILTALCQGIHNGGNNALKLLPKTIRERVVDHYVDTNCPLTASNLLPEQSIGHPDHATWILTNENKDEDKKNDDNDDGRNNDDNDGDQNMGQEKKRKIGN